MIVDVHAHLDMLEDLDEVMQRAGEAGVKFIVSNGTNPETNRKVLEICEEYDIVKPALGIYPNDALEMTDDEIEEELQFIREQEPIAIGECGIDYKQDVSENDVSKMKQVFRQQVLLAQDLKIPVIIHSRKAEEDVIDILEEIGYNKVVMHCFGGKKSLVRKVIGNKWTFSIPCNVVRAEHFQMIVEMTPLKQLLTETDSPFLSPYGEGDNEPSNIKQSIPKIAEIKGLTPEETEKTVYFNFQRMFL